MSLAPRNGTASTPSVVRYRDPFSIARELLSWDPFYGGRPASAFAPAFDVKETTDAFVLKADLPGVAESDLDVAVHQRPHGLGQPSGRGAQGGRELCAVRAPVRLV